MSKDEKQLLDILVKFKSMPFLELASVGDIDEKRLRAIINSLVTRELVKVRNQGDILEEIITVKVKRFVAS